jgi:hypothetical protein
MKRSILTTVGAVAVLAITAACDSTPISSEDTAVLRILLTDAPVDYLEEAWVEISRIYLIPGEEDPEAEPAEGPPFVELFNNPEEPLRYDVLTLQNGVTADLTGDVEVPAGEYNQLRMVVGASWVTLREPYEFNDGSGATKELFVPSGAKTGIKVNLHGAIIAEGGTVNEMLVDLNVNENFAIQGSPDTPAGIQGVLFTPVLRELSRNVDGG